MRVITTAILAKPCRLARCKAFFGHPRQPGGEPVLTLEPEAVIERDGWALDSAILPLLPQIGERLRETQMDLFMAASRGQWPAALPMKDAEREPCGSCPWPRIGTVAIPMRPDTPRLRACDDHAAWQGTPPREVQPGVAAMMVRE